MLTAAFKALFDMAQAKEEASPDYDGLPSGRNLYATIRIEPGRGDLYIRIPGHGTVAITDGGARAYYHAGIEGATFEEIQGEA